MNPRSLGKNLAGQSRILEAVIAAAIIFIVFAAATFLIQTSDVKVLQERGDLDRLGYNVVQSLVESGAIEATETDPALRDFSLRNMYLRTAVQSYLPATIYFNLTLFNCTDRTAYIELQPLPNNDVTNTLTSFTSSTEVSSTDVMYTSKNGNVYLAVLLLARAGEGS